MITDTTYRDRTQVVSRWNHNSNGHQDWSKQRILEPKHNILMVDQLWMWKISKGNRVSCDTIITCFPTRHEAPDETRTGPQYGFAGGTLYGSTDDIRDRILPESVENRISNVEHLVGRILAACTNIFEETDVKSLQFRKFFEKAIGNMVRGPWGTHKYRIRIANSL